MFARLLRVILVAGVYHPTIFQAGERASEEKQRSSVPSTSMSSLESRVTVHSHLCRAKLVLGDINESLAQSVAAEIKRAGG